MSVALGVVFLLAGAFYLWTAATSMPLSLHGGLGDRYNRLATAFLHFHLSVGQPPKALLHLVDPYEPEQNGALVIGNSDSTTIYDDILYKGRLYFSWGPAPALVLLVPMHLLGLEPSASLTISLFAIAGLGFALASLRVLLRLVDNSTVWMSLLAGCTLALCSAVPFVLRSPSVAADVIAGGFCFVMAGTWLVLSAVLARRMSLARLLLMSLCFGLAAGSRPTLGLTALVLVPVYFALRGRWPGRGLPAALFGPVGACFLLLLAYNRARFGQFLEFGTHYQLAGYNPKVVRFAEPSYVPPGAWFYMLSPPRLSLEFPFVHLTPQPVSYPGSLPVDYVDPELTGGLIPMAPIVAFLLALPWIWRRRPALLGRAAAVLLILAVAGLASMAFASYEFFSATERYEVDFSTLLLLGALAVWVIPLKNARRPFRWLLRVGGGALALWGCLTGMAISFVGHSNLLASGHPHAWSTLERLTSPLPTAIAVLAGRPLLANVAAHRWVPVSPVPYTSLATIVKILWLDAGETGTLTVVSPDSRRMGLLVNVIPGNEPDRGGAVQVGRGSGDLRVSGPGRASHSYTVPPTGVVLRLAVRLNRGLNHVVLSPVARTLRLPAASLPESKPLLVIRGLALVDSK